METDPNEACRKNVLRGVETVREALKGIGDLTVLGAVYDIAGGTVDWL